MRGPAARAGKGADGRAWGAGVAGFSGGAGKRTALGTSLRVTGGGGVADFAGSKRVAIPSPCAAKSSGIAARQPQNVLQVQAFERREVMSMEVSTKFPFVEDISLLCDNGQPWKWYKCS